MKKTWKEMLYYYYIGVRALYKNLHLRKRHSLDEYAADLIRNTHSIEKGLSIKAPRLNFGHSKQADMLKMVEKLKDSGNEFHREACEMALDALQEYIEFHKARGIYDDYLESLHNFIVCNKRVKDGKKRGGTLLFYKNEAKFNINEIEHFFNSRHSIRDFAGTEVEKEKIEKALMLAKKAPSACNRQGVRTYVLGGKKRNQLAEKLKDVGGFAEEVDKFIVITGKISTYKLEEMNQYIVSASIYAAYLSLSLHLYEIGSCIIQRPVVWTNAWEELRDMIEADKDEQIICLIAIGNLKECCRVPLSWRLENDEMVSFIDD